MRKIVSFWLLFVINATKIIKNSYHSKCFAINFLFLAKITLFNIFMQAKITLFNIKIAPKFTLFNIKAH
jgi:hypothetical protein